MTFQMTEQLWVETWSKRLDSSSGPVLAEVRFDLKSVSEVDLTTNTFEATAVLALRVNMDDIFEYPSERKANPLGPYYVEEGNLKIAEWDPWLEFIGDVKTKKWVREIKSEGALIYVYEVSGAFPLGFTGSQRAYPFDFHEFIVTFTSNWEADKLIFVPWDCEWSESNALHSLKNPFTLVDARASRIRDVKASPCFNQWTCSSTPMLHFHSSQGFKQQPYSQVSVQLLFERRGSGITLMKELLSTTILSFVAPLSMQGGDSRFERVAFVLSLVVSLSVGVTSNVVLGPSLIEGYKIGALASVLIILMGVWNDQAFVWPLVIIHWVPWLLINAVSVLYVLSWQTTRDRLRKKYNNVSRNDTETVAQILVEEQEKWPRTP